MNEFKIKNGLVVDQGGAQITGSLSVTEGITGSLQGTASFATNALTASYIESVAGANITGSFTDQSTWTFVHGLANRGVIVQVYDINWDQIIPQSITLTDSNTTTITFPSPQSGYAIATLGGTTSIINAVSASYAVSASNVPLDATPTDGSSNAVSSNGVFDALALKQDDLWNFKNKGIILIDDFNLNNSNNFLVSTALGGGNPQPSATYPNRTNQNGVVFINTSTSASGFSAFNGASNYFLGAGVISYEVYLNVETLSTSLERFYSAYGFFQTNNYANSQNVVCFMYDEGGVFGFGANPASPNWKCLTINSGVRTFTTTSVAVTASAWVKLRIEINANASSVEFFIDNVSVATHTTNIPSTSTALAITNFILKTIGTTNRQVYLDYAIYRQIFTTAR